MSLPPVSRLLSVLVPVVVLIAACTSPADTGSIPEQPSPDVPPTEEAAEPPPVPLSFPGARAISIAADSEGGAYILTGQGDRITVTPVSADGTLGEAALVNPDTPAYIAPIEPPGIAVDALGQVHVAWVSFDDQYNAAVWHTRSEAGSLTFGAPVRVDEAVPQEYATMVNVTVDDSGNPLVTWLGHTSLEMARSEDGGQTFTHLTLDTEVCDCCRPQPVVMNGQIYVAYRNSEYDAQNQNIRDVYLGWVTSQDELQAVRIPDEHWYLNACPISGPSLARQGGKLYAAWMDGRGDTTHTLEQTDIWLASSLDGGETFSPDVRINAEQGSYNNLPTIAVSEGGRIHVAWISEVGMDTTLLYTTSDDDGASFAQPQTVTSNQEGPTPGNPMLASDGSITYLVWTDSREAQLLVIR